MWLSPQGGDLSGELCVYLPYAVISNTGLYSFEPLIWRQLRFSFQKALKWIKTVHESNQFRAFPPSSKLPILFPILNYV